MKKTIKLLMLIVLLLVWPLTVDAIEPIKVNNKFGMHVAVATDEDLEAVAKLVNSSGGSWGYVTLVIQDNDLDTGRWQERFDRLRRLRLIPIIRLATHPDGQNWLAANPEDSKKWVDFFNSLNWVTKNRYLVLFNEPNHATEWGGSVDVDSYAQTAIKFAKALKKSNPDYFLMLAGLDQAAPQQLPNYADAGWFLETVVTKIGIEDFERYFDGLSSHSYPNPGFVATPYNQGWGSVIGYRSELALLKGLGVDKELPVFITETGWQKTVLGEQTVTDYFLWSFNNLWLPDTQVVAVTPFILNYQSEPFLGFSWQKQNESGFYQHYEAIKSLEKINGEPIKFENIVFQNRLPKELVEDSSFLMPLTITNLGQGLWDSSDDYELRLISKADYFYKVGQLKMIEPGQTASVDFEFHTPKKLGRSQVSIGLFENDRLLMTSLKWGIRIVPLQKLELSYRLLNFNNNASDFQVELYDQYEHLVHLSKKVKGTKGKINLHKIRNVALGEKYRIVVLKPGYLPRQTFVVFKKQDNQAKVKLMLPFDWNRDGAWSLKDLTFWK